MSFPLPKGIGRGNESKFDLQRYFINQNNRFETIWEWSRTAHLEEPYRARQTACLRLRIYLFSLSLHQPK